MKPNSPLQPFIRVATLGVFVGLLIALGVGLAPNLNTRMVQVGEDIWPNYARDLRTELEAPSCDRVEIAARLTACDTTPSAVETAQPSEDPFAGDDPFAPAKEAADPFAGDDPFAPAKEATDPFAGGDPFAQADDDPFAGGDPFADAEAKNTKPINCAALKSLAERCEIRHAAYDDIQERLTPGVVNFRKVEMLVAGLAKFPFWKHLLVAFVLLGSFATTLQQTHIALREARNRAEFVISQVAQLLAHLSLAISCYADIKVQAESTAEAMNTELPYIWVVGFLVLAGANIRHLMYGRATDQGEGTTLPRMVMVVPLYAYMVLLGTLYFQFIEGHHSGQAIFLHKFLQIPTIYLGIGLYIWAGMLLSKTTIAKRFFDVLTPFKMPPTVLAWVVIMLAAIPTAYSGASGIFVIAAGAVIFEQLTAAGARKRIALAATAMSGSLGVVLRPCLVVVLIAVLNKQVTTQQLFDNGLKVFALTAVLSLIAMLIINKDGYSFAPLGDALRGAGAALKRLVPYALVALAVSLFYGVGLATHLSEHTAPYIMPGLLLALVIYDRTWSAPREHALLEPDAPAPERLWPALLDATRESSGHIGALLTVMFASVGLGGIVERAELMQLLPQSFGSVYITMAFLVVIMVLVGMTMDALGAVVLVSVSVASVAYDNGIDPVHFWMMVLVAFELGYLTPPVALNHLLARQVIGAEARVEDDPDLSFYARYEHLIVPMAIMGTALLLVAFVPLAFY